MQVLDYFKQGFHWLEGSLGAGNLTSTLSLYHLSNGGGKSVIFQ